MSVHFRIDIELFPLENTPAPDLAGVRQAVAQGLGPLWTSMGLPLQPNVQVRAGAQAAGLFDFALYFDGRLVPCPVCRPVSPLAPLPFRILSALFEQRARLVSDEQLRLLRAQCSSRQTPSSSWASAPLTVWRDMARLLLKNGFSLDRLSNCFENWSPDQPVEAAFERLIQNPDTLEIVLSMHPELAAGASETDPGWAARLPGFYEEIFLDLGVVLPQVQLINTDQQPVEFFQLRLNDLQLPVLPGLSAEQVLYERPEAIHQIYVPQIKAYGAPEAANPLQTPLAGGARDYALGWLRFWAKRYAAWFVNAGIADALIDQLEESNRSLVVMIREQWPTYRLCGILRRLLDERVSVRNLPEILDVLLRIDGPLALDDTEYLPYFSPASRVAVAAPGQSTAGLSEAQIAAQVRANLKFQVSFPGMRGGLLPCHTFEPALLRDFREGFFEEAEARPGTVFYRLLETIAAQTAEDPSHPFFLVTSGARPAVFAALQPYFPEITVISQEEVPPFFVPSVKSTLLLPT